MPARLTLLLLFALACAKKDPHPWHPGISYATPTAPVYRGLLDRRGLVHAHNTHSHDACDSTPRTLPDGSAPPADYTGETIPNGPCFDQFRGDLCETQLDFVFLSDHRAMFNSTDYPDEAGIAANAANPFFLEGDNSMLHAKSRGDALVVRGGRPVANRVTCAGGHTALVMPGHEGNNLMPVGLEAHGDISAYGADTNPNNYPGNTDEVTAAIAQHKANGAVVLVAHPEGLSEEELAAFPLDGFEMYNVHANALFTAHGLEAVVTLMDALSPGGDLTKVPTNPDLAFLAIFSEDPNYLKRWAYVASRGIKRVMTMGSDCHQNAIPQIMSDGMRGDRYQRVMRWFTNHLLVTPNADGTWDDQNLKSALRGGRLYGAFEVLGTPLGFDFHAASGAAATEMGGEVALAAKPVLSVKLPAIAHLDSSKEAPVFTVRILVADGEDWNEVAHGAGNLSFTPTQPGAYRAEIRVLPNHLRQDLGPVAASYLKHDYVWIYANPIWVTN